MPEYAELYGRCTMAGGWVWMWGQFTYGKGGGGKSVGLVCALGPEVGGRHYVFPFTSRGELVGGLRCRSGYYSHKRAGMAT